MASTDIHPADTPLPTLSKLGNPSIPADLDAEKIATEWLSSFANFAEQGDVNASGKPKFSYGPYSVLLTSGALHSS